MLDKDDICNLIPHSGSMCLIDCLEHWDEDRVVCITNSHLDKDNPLKNGDLLPNSALIEYGAQAMAIHGALLAKELNEKMHEGYLAALRNIRFANNIKINSIKSELIITATRKLASQGNMIYDFQWHYIIQPLTPLLRQ